MRAASGASEDARAGSLALSLFAGIASGLAEFAVGPLCRRTGWLRPAGDGSRSIHEDTTGTTTKRGG
ncbi:hypothetical protein PSAB6_90018 [Paraburkholderia sabiae]|nr:hypothetical protein PSAB6_90018 [Paraburkholderia sabiae]